MLAGRIWRRCRAAARVARVAAAPRRRWERGRMTVQPWSDPSGLSDLKLAARIAARDRAAVRIVTARNNQRLFRVDWSVPKQGEGAAGGVQRAYMRGFVADGLFADRKEFGSGTHFSGLISADGCWLI